MVYVGVVVMIEVCYVFDYVFGFLVVGSVVEVSEGLI